MKKEDKLEVGDVVQIDPVCMTNPMFSGCFMTVTELKSFGAMGFVQSLGSNNKIGGHAYIRLKFEEFEYVGKAVWIVEQ